MKIKHFALLLAILVSVSIVGAKGYQMKKELIEPLGLTDYMEKSIFELPFLAYADEELMFYIEYADVLLQGDNTGPSTSENPTESSGQPSVPDTQPGTQPSQPTETEPSTEPSVPPVTQPKPTEPKPTEPKPTEPKPTEPKPTQPKPTDPPASKEEPAFDFPADRVPDSWFDNTLFIGDSRMMGLALYARSGNAHYFAEASINFRSVLKNKIEDKGNFSKQTLESLLSSHQYDKIVVNIGLNDAGYGDKVFDTSLQVFMETVRRLQPNAKIILNGIMPVTRKYHATAKYTGDHWLPQNLERLNSKLQSYANGVDVFYIDCTPYFADSEGWLYDQVTGDGCHPTTKYYKIWRDWMSWSFYTLGI